MKHLTRAAMIAALLTPGFAPAVSANQIERACNRSDRPAANRQLCGCIQDVADLMLSGSEQRLAATLFKDPHKSQEIRQSDRSSHEEFWQRWREFGETAEVYCAS